MKKNPINPVIVIPVFNSRDSLLILIERIESIGNYPVVVIDDGSTDGLRSNELSNAIYIKHDVNMGKGAALKTGLKKAKMLGYSHAITLDADGQHDPDLIPEFHAKQQGNPDSMIVGSRDFSHGSMPFHRKLSNNITSLMLSLRSGLLIRDAQVGYRCYPLGDSRLWGSIEDGFQFESDVYFNAARLKYRIEWQAIPVIYGGEGSHMNLVKDTLRFVRTYLRSFLW